MKPLTICLLVFASTLQSVELVGIIIGGESAPETDTFDDSAALNDDDAVYQQMRSAEKAVNFCAIQSIYIPTKSLTGCVSEQVGEKLLSSFENVPTIAVESYYANTLPSKQPSAGRLYLETYFMNILSQRFGKAKVEKLDGVLRSYFGSKATDHWQKFVYSGRTFQSVQTQILREQRYRYKIRNPKKFWNSVYVMQGYGRTNGRYSMHCYSQTVYGRLSKNGRFRLCRVLLRLAKALYRKKGFSQMIQLLGTTCPKVQQFINQILAQPTPSTTTTTSTSTTTTSTSTTTASTSTTATTTSTTTTTTTAEPTTTPSQRACGTVATRSDGLIIRSALISLRVINGDSTEPGEYPFAVAISFNGLYGCTGTVIDDTHIMTAAHCADGQNAESITVAVAEYDRSITGDGEQVFQVTSIDMHPAYDRGQVVNDIAILTLSGSISEVADTEPVCLPTGTECTDLNNALCTVAGWGATSQTISGPILPNVLQDAPVQAYNAAICPSSSPSSSDPNTQICAVGNTDTCAGDSGGPLTCEYDGKWVQCGITSYGPSNCNQAGSNGIYTNVASYDSWISSVINP